MMADWVDHAARALAEIRRVVPDMSEDEERRAAVFAHGGSACLLLRSRAFWRSDIPKLAERGGE